MKSIYIILAAIAIAVVLAMPVSAVGVGYESKIVPVNILNDVPPPSAYGYVTFYLRAGGSAEDLNVYVVNDLTTQKPFDSIYNPDKTGVKGQNPDYMKIQILPDGESDLILLASGNFTAYMQNGNGGQMEGQHFQIGGGMTTRVQFLGHAVSSLPAPIPTATPTPEPTIKQLVITKAMYGMDSTIPNRNPNPIGLPNSQIPVEQKTWTDVTGTVQSKVSNNELHLVSNYGSLGYNQMFGDPIVGWLKQLIIDYQYGGTAYQKTVWEDVDMNLP